MEDRRGDKEGRWWGEGR